jgi:hypothetical protein
MIESEFSSSTQNSDCSGSARLNLSRSGVGGSFGRAGLRLGIDAKRGKYFSIALPGTGLSYRAFFGPEALKIVGYVVIAVALCFGVLVILAIRRTAQGTILARRVRLWRVFYANPWRYVEVFVLVLPGAAPRSL